MFKNGDSLDKNGPLSFERFLSQRRIKWWVGTIFFLIRFLGNEVGHERCVWDEGKYSGKSFQCIGEVFICLNKRAQRTAKQ